MSEIAQPLQHSVEEQPDPAQHNRKARRVLAGLLSSLIPGMGHFIRHRGEPPAARSRRAILLLLLFGTELLLFWPLRLPQYMAGLVLSIMAMYAVCIFAAADAAYGAASLREKPSQWWLALLLPFAFIAAIGHTNWAFRSAGFGIFLMPSQSMEHTINEGERFAADHEFYSHDIDAVTSSRPSVAGRRIARGDLVIFKNAQGLWLVKRVVALGGDAVQGRQGKIVVNGTELREPYVFDEGDAPFPIENFGPLTVPEGQLFVLGDHRNVSFDSRSPEFGPVYQSEVTGRPLYVIMPAKGMQPRALK